MSQNVRDTVLCWISIAAGAITVAMQSQYGYWAVLVGVLFGLAIGQFLVRTQGR